MKAELALKSHVEAPQCLRKIEKSSLTYTRLPLDFNSKSMSQNKKVRMLKYEAKQKLVEVGKPDNSRYKRRQ